MVVHGFVVALSAHVDDEKGDDEADDDYCYGDADAEAGFGAGC